MITGLIKGLIVGIIVSIPVGPLGLLCIPRTLARGRWSGLSVGLGGTLSDTLYAALALFALSFINGFIESNEKWVLLAGGLIIAITGINLIANRQKVHNPEAIESKAISPARHTKEFLNGFLISVTNPGTLVCMLWLFTFIGVRTGNINVMVCEWGGVALGSGTTWFITTWIISRFRYRITLGQLSILTYISGCAILIIGAASIVKSLLQM